MKTQKLKHYLEETLGLYIHGLSYSMAGRNRSSLPFYIDNAYDIQSVTLLDRPLAFALLRHEELPSVDQIEKHLELIKDELAKTPVFIADKIPAAITRKLITKGINFIVPESQVYLPALLMHIQGVWEKPKHKAKRLSPSAQLLLLYALLNKNDQEFEILTFKELAKKFGYSKMGITKAVTNLQGFDLCTVMGTKEKVIHFDHEGLWHKAEPYLVNPIQRKVFVDELPRNTKLPKSNTFALPAYSNMSESQQEYYAIESKWFNVLEKTQRLKNANFYEGPICLEIWKYDPTVLKSNSEFNYNVDPLSLYLTLKDEPDERIAMALDQVLEEYL